MRIWALSHLESTSPGTRRFLAAARARGHEAELVHPLALDLAIGPVAGGARLAVDRAGAPAPLPDLCFTRMGSASPAAGLNALLQMEALGLPVVNAAAALWRTRDKVRSLALLAAAGLPVPASFVPGRDTDAAAVERALGPAPWVVKRLEGTKGEAVFLVDGADALAGLLAEAAEPCLVQRFVREAAGTDLRALVVGGRVLGAMRRRSGTDDFRSNLHQGGRGEPVELDDATTDLALRAAATLGLEVAGVDLLESAAGPLVIEVNGSPGLAGIEDATGLALADGVVAHLEARVAAG